jgi:hypothetical protein
VPGFFILSCDLLWLAHSFSNELLIQCSSLSSFGMTSSKARQIPLFGVKRTRLEYVTILEDMLSAIFKKNFNYELFNILERIHNDNAD